MAQIAPSVGIDCSGGRLDVHVYPLGLSFAVDNDPAGWRELARRLLELSAQVVALESSGGCEKSVCRFLLDQEFSVRLLDPHRVRQFAGAAGRHAKNDRLDAEIIARFVATMPTRPLVRQKTLERLVELATARGQLLDQLTVLHNQARYREDSRLCRMDERRARQIEADVKILDRLIAEAIEANADLSARNDILRSMKGVGPVLAHTILALLPELGTLRHRQIAALVGVAPFDDQTASRDGVKHIKGGRTAIRNVLYMAAMAAARYNPALKQFHQRLKALGKKPKVAIVAVMRKMIVILNALVRDGATWQNKLA